MPGPEDNSVSQFASRPHPACCRHPHRAPQCTPGHSCVQVGQDGDFNPRLRPQGPLRHPFAVMAPLHASKQGEMGHGKIWAKGVNLDDLHRVPLPLSALLCSWGVPACKRGTCSLTACKYLLPLAPLCSGGAPACYTQQHARWS